jgi:hypothetical protein
MGSMTRRSDGNFDRRVAYIEHLLSRPARGGANAELVKARADLYCRPETAQSVSSVTLVSIRLARPLTFLKAEAARRGSLRRHRPARACIHRIAWSISRADLMKGLGPIKGYSTYTFEDGSSITASYTGEFKATGGARRLYDPFGYRPV